MPLLNVRPCQIVNLLIGPLVLVPHDPLVLFHGLLGGDVVAPHFGELLVDLHIELCLELRQDRSSFIGRFYREILVELYPFYFILN